MSAGSTIECDHFEMVRRPEALSQDVHRGHTTICLLSVASNKLNTTELRKAKSGRRIAVAQPHSHLFDAFGERAVVHRIKAHESCLYILNVSIKAFYLSSPGLADLDGSGQSGVVCCGSNVAKDLVVHLLRKDHIREEVWTHDLEDGKI